MLGGSARWGRWWGRAGSPSPERRRGRGQVPPPAGSSQLLVETGRSWSETDLPGELDHRADPTGAGPAATGAGGGTGARPRTRTYSLTRLHYSVYLEPDGEAAATATEAGAATLPRLRPPITIIGEETRVTDDEPVDDHKKKRKRKPLRKFLSVDNLRKSVRKSKERMQGIDETLRRQARNTLKRMRSDRKGFGQHSAASPPPSPAPSPSTAVPELEESETELPPPPPSPPGGAAGTDGGRRLEVPSRNISFAEDSLTTSDEPGSTPVPHELSIQHELAMAEQANNRADASAAVRSDGEPTPAGSGSGGRFSSERARAAGDGTMDSTSDQQEGSVPAESGPGPEPTTGPANGQPPKLSPAASAGPGPPSGPATPAGPAPVNAEDAQVERAEQVIEDQERARHRRLTDVGDNEVGQDGAGRNEPRQYVGRSGRDGTGRDGCSSPDRCG